MAAGKINATQLPALLAFVKNKALESVKADASAQGLWSVATSIFGNNEGALLKWLADTIESQVAQLPPSGLQTVPAAPVTAVAPTAAPVVAPAPAIVVTASPAAAGGTGGIGTPSGTATNG